MLEADVEKHFVTVAKRDGWLVFKLTFIGFRGAPDRIIIRRGVLHFVELKRPKGGKVSGIQGYIHRILGEHGFPVKILNTINLVDEFFKEVN